MKSESHIRQQLREIAKGIIERRLVLNSEWKYPRNYAEDQLHHHFYCVTDILNFSKLENESLFEFIRRAAL